MDDYITNMLLDFVSHLCYESHQPRSSRGVSGDGPVGGARRSVPRLRLVTAAPGGPGPRPPGTMTWPRGARCTDPEEMPEMEARAPAKNRHGGAPRGARPPAGDDKAPRKRLACRVTSTPGCRVMAPRVSRRSATPRRVAKEVSNPGRTASRERDGLFDIVKKRVRSASATPGQEQCATAGPLPCDAGAIPPESGASEGPLAVQASEERNSGP